MPGHQVTSIYYECGDNLHAWDLAKAALETFPTNITEVDIQNRLLKHLLDSGWSIEQADDWLASMPPGAESFWRKARLYFNRAQGRGEALEQAWAQQLRQNPNAIQPALEFLDALLYARSAANQGQQPNLFWMTEVLKPTRATEASEPPPACRTSRTGPPRFPSIAKPSPFPSPRMEISKMSMMRQVMLPGDTLRASFDTQVRESLAQCLLATGDAAEAQKWMVQAQDIREKHNLSRNASLAGQVQARSNERTIEARIQAEEKTSEDDPNYWTERAQYYAGRNEPAQQEEALKRALALTVPKPRPERGYKGYIDWRGSCLQQYANFLQQQKRMAEAPTSSSTKSKPLPPRPTPLAPPCVYLCFDLKSFLRVDDDSLWTWLRNRPRWEFPEDRLLWVMLQAAKPAELDQYFPRAENLACGQDPTRLHSLGWVMNRMQFPGPAPHPPAQGRRRPRPRPGTPGEVCVHPL